MGNLNKFIKSNSNDTSLTLFFFDILRSSTSSGSAVLASTQEEKDVTEEDKEAMESSQPARPTYEERFLSGHNHPVTVSLRWRDYEPYSVENEEIMKHMATGYHGNPDTSAKTRAIYDLMECE
uniref:Uncharacterized protein n=1 Tax=Sinocyclocheilus anshuiensis TaxID=1608454 RepID=A0A671N211_9TELE